MLSVITLTYKRHQFLEEAIHSFLIQECDFPTEMVVINDNSEVEYVFSHPNVRIINHKSRFPSISAKLKWGMEQCKYDNIYRLDDDDLLAKDGLKKSCQYINDNPGYDIYRSSGFYFFVNNEFHRWTSNINNGNIYTKQYLQRIEFPDSSIGEDADITFHKGGTWWEPKYKDATMIYRWGMGTLHISGMGVNSNTAILDYADEVLDNTKGTIELHPNFKHDYYGQIDRNSK